MHAPCFDRGHPREERHAHRHGTPAQGSGPWVREVSAGNEDEETAEHAQHEPGRNRDMNRSPPRCVGKDGGAFLESTRGNRMKEKANRNEDAGQREDVSTRLRGVGIAKSHAATASFSGRYASRPVAITKSRASPTPKPPAYRSG